MTDLPKSVEERAKAQADAGSGLVDPIRYYAYLAGAREVLDLVEAMETWKKQVDAHEGQYHPGNYKQINDALRKFKGENNA